MKEQSRDNLHERLTSEVAATAQSHQNMRRETVVIHHNEPRVEPSGSLHNTDLKVRIHDKLRCHEAVHLRVPGRATHNVSLGLLIGHGDSGYHIGSQVDRQDEHSRQRRRSAQREEADEGRDL